MQQGRENVCLWSEWEHCPVIV